MRKYIITILILTVVTGTALAQKNPYVHGYIKKNGTYVQPHHQTAPDHNVFNNYSTKGNVNPYNGKVGRVSPMHSFKK